MQSSPFSQLLAIASQPSRGRVVHRLDDGGDKPVTKTSLMRDYLRKQGKATAADLAIEAGIESTGLVWALLKADIAKGAIERQGTHYVWIDSFDAEQHRAVQSAIKLLKALGYSVKRKAS